MNTHTQKKRILIPVINDLNYDQRMIRICTALARAGYDVTLIGPGWPHLQDLSPQLFRQVRLPLRLRSGKLMYLLFWIKVFLYLIRNKADVICAVDLDTIIPVYYASLLKKNCEIVYDAHEIFTEMQEVNKRPSVKKMWEWIGRKYIPRFKKGYTISPSYAQFFKEKYQVDYGVVRNATVLTPFTVPNKQEKIILYQGAVNEGRAFEYLIPAMKYVNAPFWIVGKGNFMNQLRELIVQHKVEDKVIIKGHKRPSELKTFTENAWVGITLFDNTDNGVSNYLSMANRFFDYMHNGVPQLACNFPEYRAVNQEAEIAVLIDDIDPSTIASALNRLIEDEVFHNTLSKNAMILREKYCWQNEEKFLLNFYKKIFEK